MAILQSLYVRNIFFLLLIVNMVVFTDRLVTRRAALYPVEHTSNDAHCILLPYALIPDVSVHGVMGNIVTLVSMLENSSIKGI